MTHHIEKQVHTKFKVFSGELSADGTIGKLANEVAAFAGKSKIAAKSIGVAHLEDTRRVVITLGYRDDETPYPIKLHSVPIGTMEIKENDLSTLEKAISKAAGNYRNIICHELYLSGRQNFMMVIMTHEAV